MSFILDALRKSERERQRNRAPGIAEMRRAQGQQKRSLWLPLAALLAGLNIALLALLWYDGTADAPVAATPAPANTYTPEPPRVAAAPARQQNRDLSSELDAEPARFATVTPPRNTVAAEPADIEIPPAPVPTRASSSGLTTVTEALLDGSLNIKPLNLDIHVYSDKPAERFVFINTSRYGEGERTSEGPTVAAINPEGVVLSYQGRDYLLTR